MIIIPIINTVPHRRTQNENRGMLAGRSVALAGMALGSLKKNSNGKRQITNMFNERATWLTQNAPKVKNKTLRGALAVGSLALGCASTICVCEIAGEILGKLCDFITGTNKK